MSELNKYHKVCQLIDLMNRSFSRLMLTYALESFSFYSVYLKEIVVSDGECMYTKVKLTMFFVLICIVFYMCAEIAGMVICSTNVMN